MLQYVMGALFLVSLIIQFIGHKRSSRGIYFAGIITMWVSIIVLIVSLILLSLGNLMYMLSLVCLVVWITLVPFASARVNKMRFEADMTGIPIRYRPNFVDIIQMVSMIGMIVFAIMGVKQG